MENRTSLSWNHAEIKTSTPEMVAEVSTHTRMQQSRAIELRFYSARISHFGEQQFELYQEANIDIVSNVIRQESLVMYNVACGFSDKQRNRTVQDDSLENTFAY